MRYFNTLTVIIGVVLLAFFGLSYWMSDTPGPKEEEEEDHEISHSFAFTPQQIQENSIVIIEAAPGDLETLIRVPAKITMNADQIAYVYPKVPGIIISAKKNAGERVKEGEVLASVESRELAEAKTEYLGLVKKQKSASTALDREQKLYEKKITSAQDYQEAVAASEESLVNLLASQQKLRTLGLDDNDIKEIDGGNSEDLRVYTLHSPINGIVIKRDATRGEYIGADHETYVVADLDNLWAELTIYPSDLPLIKKGQRVEFENAPHIMAIIQYVQPVINEDTRTASAIAKLNNPHPDWLPGTLVWANIHTGKQKAALVVPQQAVQKVEGQDCIFVRNADGFEMRQVSKGNCDDQKVEILSGLNPGERYASGNTFILKAEMLKETAEHMD